MTRQNQRWRLFAGVHAAVLALGALAKLVIFYLPSLPLRMRQCPFPRLFHLYCPGCGGTRATAALLSGQLADAFRFHPMVPLTVGWLLVLDLVIALRIARNREHPLAFSHAVWILPVVLFGLYAVVRDVALVDFGWDAIGDLAAYWN